MADQLRLAQTREEEIASIISRLSTLSDGFRSPKLVLIGGYALRAFVPFSRSTRDCDFAVRKGDGWCIGKVRAWFPELQATAMEERGDHGFLSLLKIIRVGKSQAKVSLDFMEGKVVGRTEGDAITLDAAFERDAQRTSIAAAGKPLEVLVPSYRDYFIMKAVSARRSDIRDIAALVWKKGVPDVEGRLSQVLPDREVFYRKIREVVIPDLEDPRFVHSWRGTFVTTEFTDADKQQVIDALQRL